MKWISLLACSALLTFSFSCNDDDKEELDCIDATIKREKMIPYRGETLECNLYLALYTLNEQKYFNRGTTCPNAIMPFAPFNCSGDQFCDSENSECFDYFQENATYIGIVAYRQSGLEKPNP